MTQADSRVTSTDGSHPSVVTTTTFSPTSVRTHLATTRKAFMALYDQYKAASPAAPRKALLRLLLERGDEQLRVVEAGMQQVHGLTLQTDRVRAAVTAQDSTVLQRFGIPSFEVASRQVAASESAIVTSYERSESTLTQVDSLLRELTAVMEEDTSTPEDTLAHVRELEAEIARTNKHWEEVVAGLTARLEKVETAAALPRADAPAKKPVAKKPVAKKTTRSTQKPPAKK